MYIFSDFSLSRLRFACHIHSAVKKSVRENESQPESLAGSNAIRRSDDDDVDEEEEGTFRIRRGFLRKIETMSTTWLATHKASNGKAWLALRLVDRAWLKNFSAMRCWRFARCKCQKHTSKTQCDMSCKRLWHHSRRSIVLVPRIIEFHMTFMLSSQLDIHICSLYRFPRYSSFFSATEPFLSFNRRRMLWVCCVAEKRRLAAANSVVMSQFSNVCCIAHRAPMKPKECCRHSY